jgi:hypothetical protein
MKEKVFINTFQQKKLLKGLKSFEGLERSSNALLRTLKPL